MVYPRLIGGAFWHRNKFSFASPKIIDSIRFRFLG
jgi:hypothetical protein